MHKTFAFVGLAMAIAGTPAWSQIYGEDGLAKVIHDLSTMEDADLNVHSPRTAKLMATVFDGEINDCSSSSHRLCSYQSGAETVPDLYVGINNDRIESVILFDTKRTLGPNWMCRIPPGATMNLCVRSNLSPAERERVISAWKDDAKSQN
ncbi:hypothetical protein [Rhizobium sp. P28RR-XV]|uniref:hypothetical protein n=1 Tax=Rhizobium sp. P28RR-XV TaxID=2726737 RepID=UPI0014567521|nr:hypothetical protein [Rhizobium sp. P28RR-XV]NLR89466.1 hypothetical protein [Rhizobium sp. P28RR-XV]